MSVEKCIPKNMESMNPKNHGVNNFCFNFVFITVYWEEPEQREMLANKFGLSQIQLGILVSVTTPGKLCNFPHVLSLEIALGALKLTENCYLNMNVSFT